MRNLLVAFCFGMVILTVFPDVNAQWNITTIADAGSNKESIEPQIAQDPSGTLHIVFVGDRRNGPKKNWNLYYTNNSSGSFATPTQITSSNDITLREPEIEADSNGDVHILFENEAGEMRYMNNVAGNFGPSQVLLPAKMSQMSMTLDSGDNVHIAYSESFPATGDNEILYTNNIGGSFSAPVALTTNFDPSFPVFNCQIPDLETDSFDNLHLVFECHLDTEYNADSGESLYMNNSSGSWPGLPTQLSFNNTWESSQHLAIDGNDVAHIVHRVGRGSPKELIHLENSTGAFRSSTVAPDAFGPEIDVAANGIAYVVYRNPADHDLYLANNSSGNFTSELVSSASGTFEADGELVVDGSDVHIAFNRLDGNHDTVHYATNSGSPPPPPPGGTLHVESIDMSTEPANGNRWRAVAEVLVHDDQGQPVEGASVPASWSGLVSGSSTATTGSNGVATLESPKTKKSGEIVFTVTNVTKDGLTYDPNANVETSDSIIGPPSAKFFADGVAEGFPTEFTLFHNHPNPFNPETVIRFALPEAGHIELMIYNTRGQVIRRLASQSFTAGEHSIKWDGRDQSGKSVSSGVYLYEIQAGGPSAGSGQRFRQVKKMSLLR